MLLYEGVFTGFAKTPTAKCKTNLVEYFDATYVTGTARRIKRPHASSTASTSDGDANQLAIHLCRIPAPFPLHKWNVHDATAGTTAITS